MAAASTVLVLLDLMEAGLVVNDRITSFIREAEANGDEITAAQLKSLADQTDDVMDAINAVDK